jgi:hypothetical protein
LVPKGCESYRGIDETFSAKELGTAHINLVHIEFSELTQATTDGAIVSAFSELGRVRRTRTGNCFCVFCLRALKLVA